MRLVAPQLVVKEDDAFANDVLGRKKYGESLLNLVVRSDDELVISLDGRWGEGKTTFVKMWQGLLSQAGVPNVYVDAFANDYVDDAFVSMVSAITNYAESRIETEYNERLDELKDKAKKVGGQLLSWSARIGVRVATLGVLKNSDIEELKEIKEDLSKGVSNLIGDFIGDRLNSHAKNIALIQSFREVLSALPPKLQDGGDKPLVVIIDELDRCKPTFAVEIIENVKHLFSVKNVVFVLVMNRLQLEESIKSVYGVNVDAHTYLQKFINLETRLPKRTEGGYENDLNKYARRLLKLHELQAWGDDKKILEYLEPLANHFHLSLRQMERVFTNLAVLYGTSAENHLRLVPIIVFLAVVKVIDHNLFENILRQRISYNEIRDALKLSDLDERSKRGGDLCSLLAWVQYALLSDEEFGKLAEDDPIKAYSSSLWRYNIRRENLIPIFAQQLNIFVIT